MKFDMTLTKLKLLAQKTLDLSIYWRGGDRHPVINILNFVIKADQAVNRRVFAKLQCVSHCHVYLFIPYVD